MRRWARWEKVLLGAFLFWSAAGLIFTLGKISALQAGAWPLPVWLTSFVRGCIEYGDPILILLAFANTHANAARQWSAARARHWVLILLVASLLIETIGVLTGFPFGHYRYTGNFGPMLGVVPLTIPLAWYVVVTNAFFLAARIASRRHNQIALTALTCTAYDFILEPFASGAKHYWLWTGGTVPLQNYLAWLVLSGALAGLFAPRTEPREPRDLRPAIVLGLTVLIFLAGR